jgi:hypothetical protein
MKHKIKLLAVLALTALIGIAAISCDTPTDGNGGNGGNGDPCAEGHAFPAWTAPTCTVAGNNVRTCTRDGCDQEDTRTSGYTALGHDHSIVAGSGSLVCRRDECDHQYQLGDIGPGGGVIFYVADGGSATTPIAHTRPNGFKFYRNKDDATGITAYYLEAAPVNALGGAGGNDATMMWRVGDNNTLTTTMTNIETTTIGTGSSDPTEVQMEAINNDIGMGKKNTDLIVEFYYGEEPIPTYKNAARAADTYTSANGTSDWFLPSIGELYWLYQNIVHLNGKDGITIMETSVFWSSSQNSANSAWYQSFNNGNRDQIGKGNPYRVRAVRAF